MPLYAAAVIKPTTNPENYTLIGRSAMSAGLASQLTTIKAAFQHGNTDFQAWHNPAALAPAFAWLANQPAARFQGLRFDAGPIVEMLEEHNGMEKDGFEARVREISAANSWVR